ncbi:hypothetical protein C8R47DRAFT_420447 [Mycena vitilis]|nr:hypothetical protein C8R47DRAFT_420447 [Mycena vitilis]
MPLDDVAADSRIASIDAQTLDIQHTLAESWSDITDGSDLATLWFEKMVTKKRLNSYKYPVLTLPSEIVSEMFIHFLPAFPGCRPPIAGKPRVSRPVQCPGSSHSTSPVQTARVRPWFAPIDSLAEMISKSGCNLQEVRILQGKYYIPEDVYRDVFRDIPKISVT